MRTSLVITIALFTIFTISEISCKNTCSQFRNKCLDDSDCCSNNCYMAGNVNDRFCMYPVNTTADAKVEYGFCSYNASFHSDSSNNIFKLLGITAAHAMLPVGSEMKLTNMANNKTIDVTINTYMQPKNGTILRISKEAARGLGVKDGETFPCSLYMCVGDPDISTFKKMAVLSSSLFIVVFIIMTFII
ncbi:uncharacterized protein LOC100570509 [Acyrthosiphon pisum]|uniref:Uncharacterized protein n=1 Tax=Acyrthosiphon pisum TaxID=7029 RepID=A0A8R2ACU1_ACYPI|nr:uncharacterized protein LOC100570509 [Acyrthosiphon pisum]|eukprot:XP_003248481.1 PREDICTED: uncharacterized protein LOC100570509 [Acyrthosiphon pisum]